MSACPSRNPESRIRRPISIHSVPFGGTLTICSCSRDGSDWVMFDRCNDKVFALVPPYAPSEQQALKAAMLEDVDSDRWGGQSKPDAKRYSSPVAEPRMSSKLDGSDV